VLGIVLASVLVVVWNRLPRSSRVTSFVPPSGELFHQPRRHDRDRHGEGETAGAELAEKAAVATEKVKETIEEAGITTKIKAKMALDDSVKAGSIDVTTAGSVVRSGGKVRSVRNTIARGRAGAVIRKA
jgi:hypothetical protein